MSPGSAVPEAEYAGLSACLSRTSVISTPRAAARCSSRRTDGSECTAYPNYSGKRRRAVAVGCSGPYAASSIVRARSSSGRAAAGSPRSGPASRCRRQQVRSAHAGRPICPVCTCPTLTDASVADLRAQLVERICISVGTHLGIAKHLEHLAAAGPLVPQVALVFAWLTLPQANGAAGRTAPRLSSLAPPWPAAARAGPSMTTRWGA